MDKPNITIEEYIRSEEEKAHRRGKVYNWDTATYGKIWDNEDVHDLGYVETKFPAIVFNDTLIYEATLSCEPTVSSLNNDEIDFRISFDESDDEDCTVIFDKNSFSYKIISVNDLKTDSENDNEKASMPSFPPPEPMTSYLDDLDFLNNFENEFPAIVYNGAQTSKLNFLAEPTLIYPDDLKSDKDNDDDKIDIEHSLGDLSIKPLPDVINTNVGPMHMGPRERKIDDVGEEFTNLEILKCWSLETSRRLSPNNLVKVDDPNITIEEYIRLEEEKARRHGKVYNWKTATYGKIRLRNDLENEFPAIVYNDAQTSKLDFSTEPVLNPQHINEFDLKSETSLSECDEEEQNVLNFNDLFPFNIIYPNDSKSDKDNDDDKIDIEHSSGDLLVKPLPDVINTDVDAFHIGQSYTFRNKS
ncbi:hypothetical protein Tco_0838718 [Tanacetum coccineum]|uniref:Uncharacterized protein n=1 Tax=Tanacetum coccineum TaxID=301880 RepID=A0ABQ5APM8_9ASTR